MKIVFFEDELVPKLHPVTISKPAFTITCASYRLCDLLEPHGSGLRAVVRPHLTETLPSQVPPWDDDPAAGEAILLVNARLVPCPQVADEVRRVISAGTPGIWCTSSSESQAGRPPQAGVSEIALALVPAAEKPLPRVAWNELRAALEARRLDRHPSDLPLLGWPHDILRNHLSFIQDNLRNRLGSGTYREIAAGVFAAADARLGDYVVSDTSTGPIVIDERASIGPYCYLRGPAYIGPGARVIEHAAIKDSVSLGHTTKVGGEVEGSIVEPYTNKQHHGFLGHSYLGSWVNLGAGTCNSDLKNTYGNVNMEYDGKKIATGMQFVGCFVGDYAKTAINTGIFTGKTVGACSMVYGFVTTNVPSFVNYARSFGQVTEAPVEVMVATQARMFSRRNVVQRPSDIRLLQAMYDLTRLDRQIAGEPLSL